MGVGGVGGENTEGICDAVEKKKKKNERNVDVER